jgi:hypothetical protein
MRACCAVRFPDASPEQFRGGAEVQRVPASPKGTVWIRVARDRIEALDLLPRRDRGMVQLAQGRHSPPRRRKPSLRLDPAAL